MTSPGAADQRAARRPGRGYRTPRCIGCGLPSEICICADLPQLEHAVRVTILVERGELAKPSNTARLAARMLTRCELVVRGDPDPRGPLAEEALLTRINTNTLLLYPSPDAEPLDTTDALDPSAIELVVPDGTWSQTRRLVRRYPALQRMRAVRLPDSESHYALRRSAEPGLLCTLEAIALALGRLEVEGTTLKSGLQRGLDLWQRRMLTLRGQRLPWPELGLRPGR